MSELGSFSELADVKGNEVERPKPLPQGHYSCLITGMWKENKAKSGNLSMRFPVKIVEALSDVDADELAEAGSKPLEREYTIDFWMSPDARWRFTEFCKAMDIDQSLNLLEMAEQLATCGEPFMKRTTSFVFTSLSMNSLMPLISISLACRVQGPDRLVLR